MKTFVVSINGSAENWSPEAWRRRFAARLPGHRVVLWPDDRIDPASVAYMAVWKPPAGLVARFPKLEAVFNLGAGVDAILADPTVPAHVPLVRVVNADLTQRMTEYLVLHALMHHRRQRMLDRAQAAADWSPKDQWPARDVRIGILGLGELGIDAGEVLARIGFQVAGWSRSPKEVAGIACFHGHGAGPVGLDAFLGRTDILIALLPLTPDTRGILARPLFEKLARDGRLGAPVLINAGRGGLQVEADILASLDDGTLGAVTLDVFDTEPLPADHPFWRHPKVTVTPHNAADSSPDAISDYIVEVLGRYERGQGLVNVVDRARGY
jgi:glyoxylate/hydroxypyruvate reductase A